MFSKKMDKEEKVLFLWDKERQRGVGDCASCDECVSK